jgi:hypothetical protein
MSPSPARARQAPVAPLESDAPMPGLHDGFTLDSIAADARTQVVAVGGTIAMTEARTLESQVVAGIRAGRTRVVLDLTGVADAGPGLLGALLRIRRGVTRVAGSSRWSSTARRCPRSSQHRSCRASST